MRMIKNVGSKVTSKAMGKAMSTGSGANGGVQTTHRVLTKGNSAGLMNAKKVPITMNGTGYLNPNNYKARYNKKQTIIPGVAIPRDSFSNKSCVMDLRKYKSNIGSSKIFRERY